MENQSGWADLKQEVEQLQKEGKQRQKLKTGFQQLDKLLFGGLSPGLVVLGGTPGVGKSTFCLQIAEHVAESGVHVLYFSMEMSAKGLMAKSINRRMFQNGCPINAARLMSRDEDNRLDAAQLEQVEQVTQTVEFQHIQENLHIWTKPLSASGIKDKVLDFARENTGETDNTTLVIVDYLQIVLPEENANFRNDKEKNDDKVRQFTQLAHEGGFSVILVSSLNRGSYTGPTSGSIQMGSFKETGEIEYSADLLLGLQFQNRKKKADREKEQEQEKNPREVEISVLKNRYGSSGCSIPFAYYAENDCFQEQTAKEPKKTVLEFKEKETAAAPVQGRKTVRRCVFNNTKVANEIRKGKSGKHFCDVSEKNGDGPKVWVEYELSDRLSSLDCCVADAIYTIARDLWGKRWGESGIPQEDKSLSPNELIKELSGKLRQSVTPQKRKEMRNSIERLRQIQFDFRCDEELKDRWGEKIKPEKEKLREYHGPFLNLELKEQSGGEWDGAEISFKKGVCPLFLHAYGVEVNQQMITIPSVLLDVPGMSNTAENICLKRLLAQRMEVMRRNSEYSRKISFQDNSELLLKLRPIEFWKANVKREDLEKPTEEVWRQKLKRLHESTEKILEYYKQIQYISGYQEDPKSKSTTNLPTFIVGKIKDPEDLPIMKLMK